MSASKIKQLINEYNDTCANIEKAEIGIENARTKKTREGWEREAYSLQIREYDIAIEIKNLNPSKYMIKKYEDLRGILEYVN